MQAGHYSALLPEVFRHKTTRVRVLKPQAILLDFHGTISERRWEDKVIFPYVRRAVASYMLSNWDQDIVQRCVPGLRNESFEQRFRFKHEDAPIIDDQQNDGQDLDPVRLATQLADFLQWQMTTKRETRETQIIERLVWQDGFRRRQILLPLYDDVMPCVKLWHDQHKCSIHIISSVDADTLKLLFENTEGGNLDKYIAGYVGSTKIGDKQISDTYKRFYDKLPLRRSPREEQAKSGHTKAMKSPPNSAPKSPSGSLSSSRPTSSPTRAGSPKAANSPSSTIERPVLFLTDSGPEAKAASEVNGGNAFECLLVNRPGNKRIRTYYLSKFQYVDKFGDIEFVQ